MRIAKNKNSLTLRSLDLEANSSQLVWVTSRQQLLIYHTVTLSSLHF